MLRRAIILVCLCCSTAVAAPKWEIQVQTSLPESVLYLMECLNGHPHQSKLLAPAFNQICSPQQQETALRHYKVFSQSAESSGQLPGRKSLIQVLERMAADCNDGTEFLNRSRTLLSETQQIELAAAFRFYEPAYRDSLWQQAQPELQEQRGSLQKALVESKADIHLAKVAGFYQSNWSPQDSFKVSLIPIPAQIAKGVTLHAHSLGYLQVVEVLREQKMNSQRVGVIVHEIVHAIWATQKTETRTSLRKAFGTIKGRLAWQELDEALATAFGNALFQSSIDGTLPPRPWYHDEVIDNYAASLVPLIQEWLNSGKVMDAAFCAKAVSAFDASVPGATSNPRLLFRHLTVDIPQNVDLPTWLSRQTRLASWTDRNGPVDTALLLVCTTPNKAASYGAPSKTGAWCHKGKDYWTVVIVGPDESSWKVSLSRLLKLPKLTEGFTAN